MDSNAIEDRLLTVDEIAAYLGLKPQTIYNKVSQREIPFEKVGKSVRFRRATIDQWVQSHPVLTDDESGEAA